VDAELRKQPTADKGADNTDNDVTDNPKTSALHNLPGQPSSQEAHQQYDQQTLGGQVHRRILQISGQPLHECSLTDVQSKTVKPVSTRRKWRPLLKPMPVPMERLCRIAHISRDISTAMFWHSGVESRAWESVDFITSIYFLNLWAIGALVIDSATQLNLRRRGLRTQFDHAPPGAWSIRKTNTN